MRKKIIAAFLLACTAVLLSWLVSGIAFRGVLDTVDRLAAPNEKLRLMNRLFQEISNLDQRQRTLALQNPGDVYDTLLYDSRQLLLTIDTLRTLSQDNLDQVQRLDSMRSLIDVRDRLFLNYLHIRNEVTGSRLLSARIHSLSELINHSNPQIDSSVITTEKTITTTIVPSDSGSTDRSRRSFFDRLFGRKKEEIAQEMPRAFVREETHISIDTLAVAQQDSIISEVEKVMFEIETDQRTRGINLINRELKLINAGNILIAQLRDLLREMEEEEIALVKSNAHFASELVSTGINRVTLIMIFFLLGTALLVFLILNDISRSNRYRRELLAAKEEAERLGQVKQRFLANMSHEIRTPLQSILGFSEQIRAQKKPDPESLEAIYFSADHLLQIVNEVLDYSRISSGHFSFENRNFEVSQLLHELAETMRLQAKRKSLEFVLENRMEKPFVVSGDDFRLRQILYNLLGNAIKFTDKGRVSLIVSAREMKHKTEFTFQVHDSGPGISEDGMARIFNMFEQAEASVARTYGGTGLGLSIVKALTEAQQGTISVESEVGKGSCFTVKLAFRNTSAAISDEKEKTRHTDTPAFEGKVLVVDDDPFILRLCDAILDKHRIAHICLSSSQKALDTNWGSDIRLVLLDIRMPQVSGMELCRALRQRMPRHTRIVALTAQVMPDEHEAIFAEGFDQILMKPFREQDLLQLLGSDTKAEETYVHDFSALKKMTGEDPEMLRKILEQFLDDTTMDLNRLEANGKESEVAPEELLHRLAGRIAQLGFTTLGTSLRTLEIDLRNGKTKEEIKESLAKELTQVRQLMEEIKTYLERSERGENF